MLGDKRSPEAFRDLATLLLSLTVAKRGYPGLWLARGDPPAAATKATLQANLRRSTRSRSTTAASYGCTSS
jgi:hypothetical protein